MPKPSSPVPRDRAPRVPVFDGHNDVLLRLTGLAAAGERASFLERSTEGHLDLVRCREGGMGGGFFAVLAPSANKSDRLARGGLVRTPEGYTIPMAPELDYEYANRFAHEALALLFRTVRESAGQIAVVRGYADLERAFADGTLAIVAHFEGAEPIDPDLHALEVFYEAGLRSVGPVWSRPNAFGHGVPFRYPSTPDTGPGLTEAGLRLVRACNELGIVLDLAHLNERGFWDVARHTEHPLVVSHACCHAICPSARNLTDRQIDAVAASGGVIGINFFVGDLRDDGLFEPDTPLSQIARHLEYVAERVGVEHVAFGSDFDGARIPLELGDVTGLPRLVEHLRSRGWDDDALTAVTHRNWFRVLEATLPA